MSPRPLRLATRRSALALAQSRAVGEQLAAATGRPLELVEVITRGDVDAAPLTQIGGTGVFVAAVRRAVAEGAADVAVHSLKDLPTAPDARLSLAAVPMREDPRDVLVSADGSGVIQLPPAATVGTGSPRRRAQLLALRPDLQVVDLRGNVDTRLARVRGRGAGAGDAPGLDAVVLAAAGLARLGRSVRVGAVLPPEQMLPAPGQGALAVEVRADLRRADPEDGPGLLAALAGLDHGPTRAAVTAERALLAALGAGCAAPVGALAEAADRDPDVPSLTLRAVVAGPDGTLHRASRTGPVDRAEQLGHHLARRLLEQLGTPGTPRPPDAPELPRTPRKPRTTAPRPTARGSHQR